MSLATAFKRLGVAIAATAAALTMPISAWAMSVTPVLVDMKPSGRESSAQVRVINTGAQDLPVELSVLTGKIGVDGELVSTPYEGEDLLVFPPQALIAPGATQVFRLQWTGEPELAKSMTYLVSVAQQPVALPEGSSGIQLLYDFQVAVNVAPLTGEPDLSVKGVELTKDEKGARRAALTLVNNSPVHGYLSGCNLKLVLKDAAGKQVWSQTWTPEELVSTVGIGLVQPEMTRHFLLPFDLPAEGVTLAAEIRYEGRP